MLKLSENPATAWPEGAVENTALGAWWVAHTKSRQEKALAHFLRDSELAYFLPLRLKTYVQKGKRRKSMVPLFPGYVFFRADEEGRYTALTSNRIAQVIEIVEQEELTEQLLRVHRAVESGERIDTYSHLCKGTRVRVTGGSLMGMEGDVIEKRGVYKLILNVNILGQAAALEIDADLLERID